MFEFWNKSREENGDACLTGAETHGVFNTQHRETVRKIYGEKKKNCKYTPYNHNISQATFFRIVFEHGYSSS